MIHILVVEDDRELNQAVCKHLAQNNYQVMGCLSAREGYDHLDAEKYDLIISDIMMTGIDGFEFAETIRQQDKNIPILFMTAKDDFVSKKKGYRLGIDDYMVKLLNLDELLLHIEALLRRSKIATQKKLVIGSLTMDENEVSASVDGELISLTLREFQILFKLLSYPNQTFTRSQLLDEFNGFKNESGLRTVDVHITNLRNKFSQCDAFQIVTVRGLGYKAVIQ
jgi:DNA-binding response OmpR family regulator